MITVVIPVYNRPTLVKRALESVLNQTLKPSEIIVVDDGSTDETQSVLKSYKDKIKVITQKNSGVSVARNRAIIEAKYPWITFLDSDDEWREDKLEKQFSYHKNNPKILFSHTLEEWIRNGKVIKQKTYHKKPHGYCFEENLEFCKIAPSTVMVYNSIFEKVGLFDESLEVCEDYDLWLRILKEYEVGLVEEVLTTKYAGHEQLSFKYHSMDKFRVEALLKHKERSIVKEIILKKLSLLKKGAIKHQNEELLEFCKTIDLTV